MQRCFTKIDRAKPLDSKTVLIFSVRPKRTSYELLMELMKVGRERNQVFSDTHTECRAKILGSGPTGYM